MKITGRNFIENKIISKFIKSGNENIFYFWNELNNEEKDSLIHELLHINLKNINSHYKEYSSNKNNNFEISSTDYFSIEERNNNKEIKSLAEKVFKNNEIAFLTVAGGQASRLGYESPKGSFPISPINKKTLFQIFAEKIKFYSIYFNSKLKWYIMTSDTNYQQTIDYFEHNIFFGLNRDCVIFFKQGMFPTLTTEGKLFLSEKNKIFQNPDGHGGTLKALYKQGLLKEMKKNRIKYLYYFQVDNPLINLGDLDFIGYHIKSQSQVTTKVIKKLFPEEKLGTMAKLNGKNAVVEYSDIPQELMYEKDVNGKLKYEMGSIGIHLFNVDFLIKCTKKLPIHFAKKSVDGYSFAESNPEFTKLEGIKFETFVFDSIPLSKRSFYFETERENDFAPLKNKTGVDSIETCIKGQINQHSNWIKKSGILKKEQLNNQIIEINPLYAPDLNIFIEKALKDTDKLSKDIFENGKLKNEIKID
jgi:UDP-N-acetylglucosamine/UDP-N-acetylgalactosamine diphosphorylase